MAEEADAGPASLRLVTDVLARLPEDAGDRLVLLDPAETEAPPSLNVLDVAGRDPELVVDQLVGVFHRLYAAWWGPRTEDVLRSAALTLTRRGGTTLAHVPPWWRATRIPTARFPTRFREVCPIR